MLAHVGSAGRIVGFSEQDDGRYMISLGQVSRFRLMDAEHGFPSLSDRSCRLVGL